MKTTIISLGVALIILGLTLKQFPQESNRTPAASEIVFNYSYKGKPLKLTLRNVTWEDALSLGAKKCMDFYTDGQGPSVGEDIWMDLIDVCVNPREKR